ncbi:MAG: cupin domain-containing protein [Deltaproteobacteria bacterium]|nr:cupin domain-containing protein [Deltaproteobacteria bacterium]MCL5276364.1 cupin domain-containing protein [Deltaproteobacteria bacterium]
MTTRRIDKPWGYELVWAESDLYIGKVLFLRAGTRSSLQMHRQKDETMFLSKGRVMLEFPDSPGPGDRQVELKEGSSIRIHPGTRHRINAVTDSYLYEVSTPHMDDVVRFEDDYGRTG